jgi:osmotically inducible lipoprotein OsmB
METCMKRLQRTALVVCGLAAGFASAGCSTMTEREKATAIGAGVGGVTGSVLTNGSTLGTLGGAAAGGVIGNEYGKRKERGR